MHVSLGKFNFKVPEVIVHKSKLSFAFFEPGQCIGGFLRDRGDELHPVASSCLPACLSVGSLANAREPQKGLS